MMFDGILNSEGCSEARMSEGLRVESPKEGRHAHYSDCRGVHHAVGRISFQNWDMKSSGLSYISTLDNMDDRMLVCGSTLLWGSFSWAQINQQLFCTYFFHGAFSSRNSAAFLAFSSGVSFWSGSSLGAVSSGFTPHTQLRVLRQQGRSVYKVTI